MATFRDPRRSPFRDRLWRRRHVRREGSLAAALVQSMALALTGTAGAYPSWVLVSSPKREIVLGASWAVTQVDPPPDAALLGSTGGPLMLAIAFCCLFSVMTGSFALTLDFLGQRWGRTIAPPLHGLTAVLMGCSAALGTCLLGVVRGRVRTEPELISFGFTTTAGQSLFLACLACVLASTATGLSCTSPARVQPARSSWDLGRPARRRRRSPSTEKNPCFTQACVQEERFISPLPESSGTSEDCCCPGRQRWHDYSGFEIEIPKAQERRHRGRPQEPELRVAESSLESRWPPSLSAAVRGEGTTLSTSDVTFQAKQEESETEQRDPCSGRQPDPNLQLNLEAEPHSRSRIPLGKQPKGPEGPSAEIGFLGKQDSQTTGTVG